MRVLHLLSSSGFHGAETMCAELIRHSVPLGIEPHVGVFDNGGRGDRQIFTAADACGAPRWVVPCAGQFDRAAVRAIAAYVREHRIDVVHSHKYKTTFHALLARRSQDFALLSTYHNWLGETFMLRVYAWLDKRLVRFNDAAVGVSRPVTAELARRADADRVFYIGNGIDTARFTPGDRGAARERIGLGDGPVIGFVGRLMPQKGVEILIEAFGRLGTDARLLIVGDGEHRPVLEDAARRNPGADRIRFLGTRTDTPELFRAMDVLVLPSYVEAFPMVLLEAMATQVPVIGTPVGDVPSIVDEGVTGWITPLGDPAALASRLSSALADRTGLARMGAAGRAVVEAKHSAQVFARNYMELYERIVRARRGQ